MNDNEIIKALECCMNGHCKDDCPFCADRDNCYKLDDFVLDLITRQKADLKQKDTEIDILIRKKETLKDEVSELRAEAERLKNAYKQCAWERDVFAEDTREELAKHITICEAEKTEIKTEAYKEFAERLEEKSIYIPPSSNGKFGVDVVFVEDVYNLLTELTEQ